MDSSMGYSVLSGKIQLDRQDTTLVTSISWAVCRTLSLIRRLSLCEGVHVLDIALLPHCRARQQMISPESTGFLSCADKALRPLQLSESHGWDGAFRKWLLFVQYLCSLVSKTVQRDRSSKITFFLLDSSFMIRGRRRILTQDQHP